VPRLILILILILIRIPSPNPDLDSDSQGDIIPGPPIEPCIENPTAEGCEPPSPIVSPPPPPPPPPCPLNSASPTCIPTPRPCPANPSIPGFECKPLPLPCPPGHERRAGDETGKCYPIEPPPPEENIYIEITIVNEINNKIRQIAPSTCTPHQSTINLGPGSIAAKGVRVFAVFEPCILSGGSAILNLPDSNDNLRLVAVDLQGGSTLKAVEVNLQKISVISNDQTFYKTDFARTMTGLSPITNKADTVQEINALVLLNESAEPVFFVGDNSIALNAIVTSK
jgi:hypothetical protein